MKIYIAGPITNNPGYEKQFAEAEEKLLSQGHLVINPAKNPGTCYKDYLDIGLVELMKCDAICLLPGWEVSKGAQLEEHYASAAGLIHVMDCEVVAGMNMRNRLGIVEGYRLALDKLETLSIATGKDWSDLVSEASQLSVETGISFVEAAEKVKEKYLG